MPKASNVWIFPKTVPFRSLVRLYLETVPTRGSKRRHLEYLKRHAFGRANAQTLQAQDIVAHIRVRRLEGVSAATALNELTWISTVLRAAESEGILPKSAKIIKEARTICRQRQLIAPSAARCRAPTAQELDALEEYFSRQSKAKIPMRDMMRLATCANLRAAEICRLKWKDVTEQVAVLTDRRISLDRQNNRITTLNTKAWEIVNRQLHIDRCVFPYRPKSVCAAFAIACKVLRIENLRFDDLRQRRTFDRLQGVQGNLVPLGSSDSMLKGARVLAGIERR